jgi:hypothetical protein
MADIHWLDEVQDRRAQRRSRLKKAATGRLPFLQLTLPELIQLSRDQFSPALILHLEMIRVSKLHAVRKREGWVSLDLLNLKPLGLADKYVRYRAADLLVRLDYLHTRGRPGCRLEYRLNPGWAMPRTIHKAPAPKIVVLAARKS